MACSEVLKDMHTRDAPWRDDLDVGLEAVEGKLETNLVVTLACAPVRDVVAAFPVRDRHHTARNDRSRKRSTEEVDILTCV